MLTLFDIANHFLFGADAWVSFLIAAFLSGTSIAILSTTLGSSVTNPAWVHLDVTEECPSEAELTSGLAETFPLFVAVGSAVGQNTIMQEEP